MLNAECLMLNYVTPDHTDYFVAYKKNAAVTIVMAAFSCLQEAISDAWLHVS